MNSSMAHTPNGQGMSSDLQEEYQTEESLQKPRLLPSDVRIEGKIKLGNSSYEFTDLMIMNGNFYLNMTVEMPNTSHNKAANDIANSSKFYFAPCVIHKIYRFYYDAQKNYSSRFDLSLVIKRSSELYDFEYKQLRISENFWNNATISIKGRDNIPIEEFYKMYTGEESGEESGEKSGEKLDNYSGGNRKSKSLNRRTRRSKQAVLQ
jgi:hypothetical protein